MGTAGPAGDGVFRHPVSPRYLEVDRQGVVFNMWYLAYFDDAMTGYLAAGGFPYDRLLAADLDVMVVHTELDWTGGLRFGEPGEVAVQTAAVGRTSFTLQFTVRTADGTRCRGRTSYVVVAADGSGKRPIPDGLRTALGQDGAVSG